MGIVDEEEAQMTDEAGRVINLKDKPRPDDYRQWCGKELFEASPWGNYFSVRRYGREEALRRYEEKLRGKPHLMERLPELEGKTLACWCAPEACHGAILLRLIEERRAVVRAQSRRR